MQFNICCTARSFDCARWMQVYEELHRGLRRPDLLHEDAILLPSIFHTYWQALWRDDPRTAQQEWCAPRNLRATHRIWEYVQVLACLYYALPDLRDRRILSLGAGVESPLWTLARWGADVTATDIYFEKRYWHPEQTLAIKTDPSRFCPYSEPYPVTFKNLNLKRRNLRSLLAWSRLAQYDAIYSISSLEHVYGVQRRVAVQLDRRVVRKKLGLFRRVARHLNAGGVLVFTTELITRYTEKRRLDFYTREELELVLETLGAEGLTLVDDLDWGTMEEQQLQTRDTPGQWHTAVAIALRKGPG